MLRPVGPLPPRIYWRRRALALALALAAVLLVVVTLHAVGSGGSPRAASATTTSPHPSTAASSHAATSSAASSPSTPSSSPGASATSPANSAVTACATAALKIAAATDKPTYAVGDQPVVAMQVTNIGAAPCAQSLGDTQIEFRVYNGAARVWGSHDCKIDSTPDLETLPVSTTVAKTVTWSGYSSQVGCGTRQRVGAGTYTLSVYLDGVEGTTAQFAISG
jgi:hypothetical protein